MNARQSPNASRTLLSCRGLAKAFDRKRVVEAVDLDVTEGSFTAILGPSGCGKTTLLRLIAGFERPDAGVITLDGADLGRLPPEKRQVNTVFQNYALFPHMTVRDNVAFPLSLRTSLTEAVPARVDGLLGMVRLQEFANRYPAALSGGQQQRVSVARALAADPYLLLLDEPLSALDRNMRAHVQTELKSLQRRLKLTFVMVTHDQDEALALADDVVVMSEGRIVQHADAEAIYRRPATGFVADFIGGANVIPGRVLGRTGGAGAIRTALGDFEAPIAADLAAGAEAIYVLRAEDLRPATDGPIHGEVRDVTFQGAHRLVGVMAGVTALRVSVPGDATPSGPITLAPAPGRGWITRP